MSSNHRSIFHKINGKTDTNYKLRLSHNLADVYHSAVPDTYFTNKL